MMKKLETIIANLSDEQLKEGFDEITEWHKEGVLKMDGVVRATRNEFMEANGTEIMLHIVEGPFLYEIAKRHYAKQ